VLCHLLIIWSASFKLDSDGKRGMTVWRDNTLHGAKMCGNQCVKLHMSHSITFAVCLCFDNEECEMSFLASAFFFSNEYITEIDTF